MPGATVVATWKAPPGEWTFASAPPAPELTDTVVEYWEVEGRLAPFREKILPNGCLELMVNLGPPHEMTSRGERTTWDRSWLSGLHQRVIDIESRDGTHLVSARLTPVGAYHLFGPIAAEAANRVVDLEMVAGARATQLRADLLGAPNRDARLSLLELFIEGCARAETPPSPFVVEAVRRIDAVHGKCLVSRLHEDLDVSRKHLTVRFGQEIGLPPKAYATLRRFVWTLRRLRESDSVDWTRLAADAGYSDQSHLVRDFRRVSAAPPTTYLRTRSPDNTALLEMAR